jgi:hypothetical protein
MGTLLFLCEGTGKTTSISLSAHSILHFSCSTSSEVHGELPSQPNSSSSISHHIHGMDIGAKGLSHCQTSEDGN